MVFLFTEFPLHQQISCLFQIPHLRYFVAHKHTLGYLEVDIYFQLVLEDGTLCSRFIFLECDLLLTSLFIMEKGELQSMCDKLFEQFEIVKFLA
jgi:hypothetical protein